MSLFLLSACHYDSHEHQAGPLLTCPTDDQLSYYRKSMQSLETYVPCFTDDVAKLISDNRFKSYIKWLMLSNQLEQAESALLQATEISIEAQDFYVQLAQLKAKQHHWDLAQDYIELADVSEDDPFRIKIIARTGRYSADVDQAKFPYILRTDIPTEPQQALVSQGDSVGIALTRIDDAVPGVLASETSIVASADGQNIWALWTDSSGPGDPLLEAETWKIRAASSEDGGETWHNDDFSISPELKEVYHFDPMTAYDPVNGKMYAGALTTNFSGPDFKNIYIKSWDLNTDTHNGPFIQPINTDKVWMTTDNKGGLYMAEGLFKEYFLYSNDFGVSFEPVNTGVSGQISPYPEVDDSGCLHIIDYNGYKRCDGLGGFEAVDAPNTSLELFDMGDYLPGEFRALPLRLIAFHPNGQTFIIYTELAAKGSDQIAIWMSQSSDGIVWSTPWIISPDVAGDRFLPWFEIDQQGGIHVSYADTRNNLQPDNGPEAYVDMYYSYSNDLGQSWQETRVTPTPLEVPTLTWGGYFFGDYLEMALANSSTLYLAFPWFQGSGDMDMYVAKIQHDDLIFAHDFE